MINMNNVDFFDKGNEIYRDNEWDKPKLIVARSRGSRPSSNDANWLRIPR